MQTADLWMASAAATLVTLSEVEAKWSGVLRAVRTGILAVSSREQQRLPHLTAHDVGEIDPLRGG
jgi:hypothetical protein